MSKIGMRGNTFENRSNIRKTNAKAPTTIVISTMLGAILFTVLGIFFESRLPNLSAGLYDPRITEGYIGITLQCPEERVNAVEQLLKRAGAEDVRYTQK